MYSPQLLYYPKHTLRIIRRGVLRSVERQGAKWLWSTFTLKHFYWLVAAYLLPMMTIHAIISSVSTTLFTGGMLAMVLITIQIAIDSEKLHTRFEYLSLFQYFSKDGVQIKVKPQSSHFIHYGNFLVALLLSLVTLGFSSQSFVNNEVYVAVSLVVLFVVLLQFSLYESLLWFQLLLARSPSWIVLGLEKISFLLGVPSPQFILHFKKPLFSLPLYYGLTFDFNLLSFVQVFIHLLLMTKSLRHLESKSFLSVHGPQLIFTCWFVLCRNFVDNSDPVLLFGMFISTLSIVVMFPLSFLLFLGSPIIFFFFYGFTPPFYYSIAFVIMVIVFFILAGLVFKYLKSVWMSLSLDYVMLIVIGLAVPLIMFMSGWYASLYKPLVPLPSVSMEQYLDYCGPDNWNDKNIVQTQINCIHLKDRVFSSHGVVESVKISGVVDSMADSFKLLPTSVQSALICHIGKSTPMCGNREDMSTCVQNGCHFHDTLSYTFEVKLNFQIESIKAKLIVSHQHKDFILKLKSGSSLQFNATFQEGMGSDLLTLQALHLSSDYGDTQQLKEEKEKEMKEKLSYNLLKSLKNTAAILLEILLGYTT